ncbi:MAG: sn-glycerol-3-phosphate ABC transporter substrate-binding protein UgpB [Methanomassiliicoccales archaeon]|nr:sn-glycerol-3-phosphate ABC transporter substrate-binding protein UgpB [Methanomassiliicoccales archaeon]
MKKRLIGIVCSLLVLSCTGLAQQQVPEGRIEITFWYANKGLLGDAIVQLVDKFNASQNKYWVTATYKGGYATTLADAIAAFRAGQPPDIVQVYEVGTATMMAAISTGAVYPIYKLFEDTGVPFDSSQYIPAIAGYYSLPGGGLAALPFNTSTPVLWYNKDAFQAAGLDPNAPPSTWEELRFVAKKILETHAAEIPFTVSWFPWTMLECLATLHNVPFATLDNGFGGLETELALLQHPLFTHHLEYLLAMYNEGTFVYSGRDSTPDGTFPAGKAAMLIASSALRGRISREATFAWGETFLPFYPEYAPTPYASIIGGAALWVMRSPQASKEKLEGIATFLAFLAQPENVAWYHTYTGYLPVTIPGYELARAQGYYEQNPGADVPIRQLLREPVTPYTRGIRLGDYGAIRNLVYDEIEALLQGQQTVEQTLRNIVEKGNEILRNFESIYK